MRKIIQIVHTSLDGFVAGPNGELDWFENAIEHLGFVNELTQNADAILFGRITYQMFNEYWPSVKDNPNFSRSEIAYGNWYNRATKIVLSKTLTELKPNNAILINDNISKTITQIKRQVGHNILIFGSPSVCQFLSNLNLIDEYWFFINPVVFGTGVPLFSVKDKKMKLNLIETKEITNGEVALHYKI